MSTLSTFNMTHNAGKDYANLLHQVDREYNLSTHFRTSLEKYTNFISHAVKLTESSDDEDRYNIPMKWIGMYIALASLFCVLAMVGDLIHGFRNRKLWFPCKYFTLDAVSLTVIAVAMKLPVDLNSSMPGDVDQAAKLGSMAFMCIMMANFLPSLAKMDNKELGTNILALGILVITIVVNLCIQIDTGVIFRKENVRYNYNTHWENGKATTYVALLPVLLMIHLCSALTILKSKQILEKKYQDGRETALKELQEPEKSTVEKLTRHVRNHWIMAGTSSPQFITACSATTAASGVICVVCTIIHVITFTDACQNLYDYGSGYKWSAIGILMIQFLGVVLGTISPLFRCFATLSFKFTIEWIWNHFKVFKVESYWTQKLYDWKNSSIPFSIRNHKRKTVIHKFKIQILRVCIGVQKTVVVACKMIALIQIFSVICLLFCLSCWNWLKATINSPDIDIVLGKKTKQQEEPNKDLQPYVLQLHDDMEVARGTLKMILKSVDSLIKKAEEKQPNNLMKLLEGSSGFEGVKLFDSIHVSEEALNCWSLPVVTLMSIAISLPVNVLLQKDVDSLWSSVNEGLVYVTHVQEILNGTDEYVNIQKAAKHLWVEVEVRKHWLGKNLKSPDTRQNTAEQILQWLKDMASKVKSTHIGSPNDDRFICANSMYRITETLLLSYNTKPVSHDELFNKLSSMIADILAACLTNLPQAIAMKCHCAIEKREESVRSAAQILGETKQIINSLQKRELPSLNPENELPFIDKWRAY